MNGSALLLEAREVTRVFRTAAGAEVRALERVSLAVPRGAFVAVTGPSGCGKTTLLALLGCLDRPTGGSILFEGRDLRRASESHRARCRRRLGIVFQRSPMLLRLPVWENVTSALIPLGLSARERRRAAEEALLRAGFPGRLDSDPEELSGGERRRVGIARALAARPDAILADEPTSDLDPAAAAGVRELLRSLHGSGVAVVMATHDPELAALAETRLSL